MTQNTFFQYIKNNFLLYQKKLMFFTKLNLAITKGMYKCYESHIPTHNTIIRRENLRTQKDLERINKWTNENIYKEY